MKFAAVVFACLFVAQADDMGVLRKLSENKLSPMAGLPSCITMAVESGDPSKGSSVIVFKGTSGCSISWHWHTPTEHVMIVSGSAKVEMRGGSSCDPRPGRLRDDAEQTRASVHVHFGLYGVCQF